MTKQIEHDWKRGKPVHVHPVSFRRCYYVEYRCRRCGLTLVEFHDNDGRTKCKEKDNEPTNIGSLAGLAG